MATDVGGGSAKDSSPSSLSNISLRWMVREIVKADCGIQFDPAAFGQWNIPLQEMRPSIAHELSESTLYEGPTSQKHINYEELHHSASGKAKEEKAADTVRSEESLDIMDALKEEVDQLKKRRLWWILEILPTYHTWQDDDDRWVGGWRRVTCPFFASAIALIE